jgi:hypothetical protein
MPSSSSTPNAILFSNKSARSYISTKSSNWINIKVLVFIKILVLSVYSDAPERNDPPLLYQLVVPSIAKAIGLGYKVIDVIDLTGPDKKYSYLLAQKDSAGDVDLT